MDSYARIKSLRKLRISTKGLIEVIVIIVVIVLTALRLFDAIQIRNSSVLVENSTLCIYHYSSVEYFWLRLITYLEIIISR